MEGIEAGQDTDSLIDNIEQMMQSCYHKSLNDDQRQKLLAVAREAKTALEPPHGTVLTIAKWPAGYAALRSALRMGIFEAFCNAQTRTASELADHTGAEVLLLVRIMRALVGIDLIAEQGNETYSLNALSRTLLDPTWRTLVIGMCDTTTELSQLPDFLASIQFPNPSDPHNALFHYSHKTELNMFQ
ncbi:hypothetical protein MMC34_001979 [Xylographa carneopallida]|nr:hypothetical protein [Xylographa carneopallida]